MKFVHTKKVGNGEWPTSLRFDTHSGHLSVSDVVYYCEFDLDAWEAEQLAEELLKFAAVQRGDR